MVIGANGKMGRIAIESIKTMNNFSVVSEIKREHDLDAALKEIQPDIALELTDHKNVKKNSWTIIKNNVRPIIGASGLSKDEIKEIEDYCNKNKLGGIVAPNFSLGIALITKIIKEIPLYFSDISVVEYHHSEKKDKPSGTARHTAELCKIDESAIASVRSNGFLAKQQIFISGTGERIIIDHESFNRSSFTKGIQLSCEKVLDFKTLKIGLENIV